MASPVVYSTDEELREHYERLLTEAGMPYEELKARAAEWALDQRQLSIWRTLQSIEFLLRDD